MLKKYINVLVASEFQILCHCLQHYLNGELSTTPTDSVTSIDALNRHLQETHIDVAIIDLSLLKPSGLTAIKETLKAEPGLKIIVLSRNEKEPFISKCMANGALGYISLKSKPEELLDAIHRVHNNEKYLSHEVAYDFAMSSLSNENQALSGLTNREHQVFILLAQGIAVKDIAEDIFLSPKTVHVYRANIMKKLGIQNSSELTLIALKNNMISIDAI